MNIRRLFLFVLWACFAGLLAAKVKLPNVLNSNMVLQQKKKVAVWGEANPGEQVLIEFAGQTHSTQADDGGRWKVWLNPMKASFEKRNMRIKGEENEILLTNVLVGEVWLCSGQSNMEYPMDRKLKKYAAPLRGQDMAEQEWKKASNEHLRLFLVEKKYGIPDCQTKGWQTVSPESVAPFSAAAYFFGKKLQDELQVPVGLIASSWGGSRIENWMDKEVYENATFYEKEKEAHPKVKRSIGLYYYSMIKPLAPYTLRGFTWYQGESDAIAHDRLYVEKFSTLLSSWRSLFEDQTLPMYYVQIAPYAYSKRSRDVYRHDEWTKVWFADLQTRCQELPYTGQVVITDLVDDLHDIHPSYKWEVGRRLALWALVKDYKQKKVVHHGPQLKKVKHKKDRLILTFTLSGAGLTVGKRKQENNEFVSSNEPVTWVEVAGKDGIFQTVEATIKGEKVVVDVSHIVEPQQVRLGWNEKAMPNLFNKEGLPVVPFQIDF